ncbi:MAG: thymidine phosphorylase [bacterium]
MGGFDILCAIETKKRGDALSEDEISGFVTGFVSGQIPDYQASALLMAIVLRGMSDKEVFALTEAIWRSGGTLAFPGLGKPLVDKHSTGGVGDKVTPLFVPLMMAAGAVCCKMSGRGLGHTGGTIDKLETIPGFRTSLSADELDGQIRSIGGAIVGQSADLAPADKKLYALRDVTGTVDSIPLIVASIMGKKLAGGAGTIVLDVKVGKGAFFRDEAAAREFARLAEAAGARFGRKVVCVLTKMDSPLGHAVGNLLEMIEVWDALLGKGPADLLEVVYELGSAALVESGLAVSKAAARDKLMQLIADGSARVAFEKLVKAQGGSLGALRERFGELASVPRAYIAARKAGFIHSIDALAIGEAARALGAGRFELDDSIDPFAGILLLKKPGDRIELKEPWALCYFNLGTPSVIARLGSTREAVGSGIEMLLHDAIAIGGELPEPNPNSR